MYVTYTLIGEPWGHTLVVAEDNAHRAIGSSAADGFDVLSHDVTDRDGDPLRVVALSAAGDVVAVYEFTGGE